MLMDKEEWRAIIGYEDRYEVSNFGQVRSKKLLIDDGKRKPYFHPMSGRVIKWVKMPSGHFHLTLYKNKSGKQHYVHRLVCEAFHGSPPTQGSWALHNDGDPSNNNSENLRWGNALDNAKDSVKHGVMPKGETHPKAKLSDLEIANFRSMIDSGECSVRRAAAIFCISERYAWTLKSGAKR